jgi:hypothetical protein
MPRAEIASKQAVYTLQLLLAGKLPANKREAIPLRTAMLQVEAVLKMLRPKFSLRAISAKRRNPGSARDALYRTRWTGRGRPQPHDGARGCADTALIAGKAPQPRASKLSTFVGLPLPQAILTAVGSSKLFRFL